MAVALKIQICVYLSPLTSYMGQNLCFPSNTTSLLVGLCEPWVSFFSGLIPGVLLLSDILILEFWKSFLFLWSFFRPENLLSYLTSFISHVSYPTGFIYLFYMSTSLMNILNEPLWGKLAVALHAQEHLYYAAHLILLCSEFISFSALKILLHCLFGLLLLLKSLMLIWIFFFRSGSF